MADSLELPLVGRIAEFTNAKCSDDSAFDA